MAQALAGRWACSASLYAGYLNPEFRTSPAARQLSAVVNGVATILPAFALIDPQHR